MSFNRSNGGAAIVAKALSQVGKPYTEADPPGSDFNGQDWRPGEADPTEFDCDGLAYFSCLAGAGVNITGGTAAAQWALHVGGIVPDDEPLQPGDVCAFFGLTGGPGNPGHTGIVETYNATTKTGTIVNAYDEEYGVCVIPFTRFQPTNGDNGLGWVGAYRPVNTLPAPPAPKPPEVLPMEFIAEGPASAASFLYDTQAKTRRGLSKPETITELEAVGIKNYGATLNKTFLGYFTAEANFD